MTGSAAMPLAGRVALVTGASRGIGLGIARRLVADGARVCITARKEALLQEVAGTIPDGSVIAMAGKADDPEHRSEVCQAVRSRLGALDILVNNAGINSVYGPLSDLDLGAARKILEVNVVGCLAWVQDAMRLGGLGLTEHGGAVVNMSSVTGQVPSPGIGWYGVTKAALAHLTKSLSVELAPAIRVNAVAPAVVKTQFARALYEDDENAVAATYPMKRLGAPEDVANLVAFLVSDEAAWITGQVVTIDGGLLAAGGAGMSVRDLLDRTEAFIRHEVMPAEPPPGQTLDPAVLRDLQAAAKRAGVFAPHAPAEFGGQGIPIENWSPVFQAAGYSPIGPSVLNCMAPDEGNIHMLSHIASPEQKERFLRPLVNGDLRSCFAMTEPHPGAGSDPAALVTTATKVDGGWLVNGSKRFISGAEGAAFAIVMTRTEAQDNRPAGATMLIADLDASGVRLGGRIHTIDRAIAGGHPYLHFEDVFIDDSRLLGEAGLGFRYAQVRLGPARLTHCMRWLGLARRAHDIALDRANTRELFGARMADLGIAQDLIAQSVIDIETSDAIIAKTADLLSRDAKAGSALSSVAKVHCSEAIYRVVDRAIQLCGGDGVSDALPLASYLNEVRPFRIYDGSTETHKWAIAKRACKARRIEVEAGTDAGDRVREGGAASP